MKASGSRLGTASEGDFTEVDLSKALEYLTNDDLTDEEVQAALEAIKVDPSAKLPFRACCLPR